MVVPAAMVPVLVVVVMVAGAVVPVPVVAAAVLILGMTSVGVKRTSSRAAAAPNRCAGSADGTVCPLPPGEGSKLGALKLTSLKFKAAW